MKMETKFLRLRTPVELGSQFGDWSVCWLGGWQKHRMYYLVMLVQLKPRLSRLRAGSGTGRVGSAGGRALTSQRKSG
jgi:hypothetical protein